METGKPGLASAPVHINSVAAQTEKRMDIQAPLTAVYIHTVPALPAQPYPQPPTAAREPATLHLAMPPLYSKETLPFLTLHIAGGLQSQPGLSLAAASPAARPKSAGKHVCPHCGRDCMKPSVLEKHLRCHTGERPYPCTTCGISFKTQSNLYKHKRTQAHARLSSESEQSSLGSLESMSSSRETCTSSLSLDERSQEEKEATLPAAEISCQVSATKVGSVKTQGSVGERDESTPTETKEYNESARGITEGGKQTTEKSSEKPQLTTSRHLPLQRQEATLFSNQWESSVARGKSQSHESTDSGFSESSDHNPSPGSILPDHSMDSLTESTKEHLEETTVNTQTPSDSGQGGQEAKDTAKEQEHKSLEERISKLISENSAVVEDKKLENVRPRKTVLSKQGSIDLPMPYTYKDSFHFDMRISKTPAVGLQRNKKPGFYSSVPTQHSTTMEHAPLTRSNSLPFSVTLLQPERSSPTSSYQSDYVTLVRRGSSGQINPTGFAIKPVNQQSSTHRPLVRQTAVDCNHATDGLFMNSSVEEAGTGSLSCDGDGSDICGEPSNRKFRRKKAQKFAYNKWYMYGGGTFKKLYNAEKGGDDKGRKSMTNPEHEAVQGLQKRSSEVHKESVATTTSTVIFTSSSATVYHPDCPPAKLSVVSAVDFKSSQLHTPGSSLKSPLQRNLSLSILPLPLIGSLVGHKTDSMSRADNKHTDSSSQLCGANIPSNRKKPKTDDKIICPLEMETDPNTMTHPLPSVTGSDRSLSYINLQKNVKHTQLKGGLFPPCIINANTLSVSTSPATSTPSAAKTSFLPKYQLKLPNTAEPDSNPSPQVVDESSGTDGCNFTSALSSSLAEQTPISVATCQKQCTDPVTSPPMQSCDIKKTFSSTQGQLLSPFTAATLCQAETLDKNVTSTLAVVHRQFAGTTVTTTCLQGYQGGLCSTSIQPSKTAPVQVPRPVAPVVANFPATPTTAIRHQSPAATVTAFSPHPKSPLSHTQLLPAPVNRAHASSNTPIGPCHVVPFDQMQPAAQNVFHVHTADLQICLQIISDEQLALIEPQIERPAGSNVSQRDDAEAVHQNKAPSFVTSEGSDQQQPRHQKEPDQSENLPALNMERIKSPVSVQFGKAEPILHSNSPQAAVSVESKPPEALGLSRRPHKHGHINMAAAAQSSMANVMSSAASLKGVKSGSQTSDEERALPLNHRAEKQLLPDQRVSQGGAVSQTLSGQHKLSVASISSSTVNQNNTRIEESQHKHKNQGAACNVGTANAKSEASAHKSAKSESEEAHLPLQVGLLQASSAVCADGLSSSASSFFINKCETTTQASVYCSNPVESTSSEVLNSSKHTNTGCNKVKPMNSSAPSQETSQSGSQDIITSTHSEKPPALFTSVSSCIQVERPKDIPAVLTSIQSPTAGLIEGDSLAACEAQKEPQMQGCGATPGQPDGTDWRPQQSQEPGETNHCCTEGQSGGEDKNEGIETDEEPEQWGKDETNCRYTCLQDIIKPEGEDRKANADSFKNSWLSEQHLQHLSQTHSGMSESPQQSPQQTPSMSNNLNLPASSNSQTVLFNSPQPPSEMNSFYFSQHWESSNSSSIHNQQTHVSCEANASQHIRAQAQIRKIIESGPQQTFPHQVQKQSDFAPSAQQGTAATAGNNVTGVSCCSKLTSGSNTSLVPDVKTASSTHPSQVSYSVQASRATAGSSLDAQPSHNALLDNNPLTYPQPVDYQDTKDKAPNDYMSQSSNSGRPDITNKYQSFLFAGPLHGYQPADCLTSGPIRPVQNCQDDAEDTSSSDDEGKLIIEL